MKVAELFLGVCDTQALPTFEIASVTENTARAGIDSVFVCIRGARTDGHDLAHLAYENGCRCFVAEHPLSLSDDAFVLLTPDTRKALAILACRIYNHPSHQMHVIGITGTKGKTTTAQLLFHILNQCNIPSGYIGTNGVLYQNVEKALGNTTPDAVTLQKTLADMRDAGVRVAILEVSSQALMQKRVDGIRFQTAIFTNLYTDHIGPSEHTDFAHYKSCKKRLFSDFSIENIILNADDPHTPDMARDSMAKKRISCSLGAGADLFASQITPSHREGRLGIDFVLTDADCSIPVFLPLIGECNVSNALLAAAVATRVFGRSSEEIARSLCSASVKGRGECIPLPSGGIAVIDYAHNGESLRQMLSALRPYTRRRLMCLFGSVGERTQLRRAELGRAACELSDMVFLTSDNPGCEDPEGIIDEIAAEWKDSTLPYFRNADRKSAILEALSQTRDGDILLLAGKGHEEYQLIGTQKIPFSEREIIEAFCQPSALLSGQA